MSAAESEAVWQRLEKHAQDISDLRVVHESLAGRVDTHMATTEAIADTVKQRALRADEQHREIMSAIHELRADKSERDGMAKLGRGVAIFIGSIVSIAGILMALLSHRGNPP
jgi:hypothetical protein